MQRIKFNRIAAALLTAATISISAAAVSIPSAEAQTQWTSHPYYPNPNYGEYYSGYATVRISSGYLNGREHPWRSAYAVSNFSRGEGLEITRRAYNRNDGQYWYLVRSYNNGSQGWVRGDYLNF